MKRLVIATGHRFNRLVILAELPQHSGCRKNRRRFQCQCDCGTETEVLLENLRTGSVQSCGCARAESNRERLTTHGDAATPLHRVWCLLRQRCENPRNQDYPRYGARGIRVCKRWQDYANFKADMGPHPGPGWSIDRRNNDRGYSKSNCRWATATQQANNRKSNHILTFRGKSRTISEWARETGLPVQTLSARARRGWSHEKALTEPLQTQYAHRRPACSMP